MNMELVITTESNKTMAAVTGRLDATNSEEFEQKMQPMLSGENPDITIDCSKLDYISSSGLRLFLILQKSVNTRNGKMTIRNLKPEIKEIFDMTGFSTIMQIG